MALNSQIFGKKIQRIRKAKQLSQSQLAEMIHVSTTYISRIERGEKTPALEMAIFIADALHVSLDGLVAESRTFVPKAGSDELSEILNGCSTYERYLLVHGMCELKEILLEARDSIGK